MTARTKAILIFLADSAVIGVGALALIFLAKIKAQIVAPLAGLATVINVALFARRFDKVPPEQSIPRHAVPAGITFLRIVMVITLCALAVRLFTDFWEALPQAVFALGLLFYVSGRIKYKLGQGQ
jgi:hypothetical protein